MGSRQARAIAVHRERDLDMVVRRVQDALFPFVLVALAWLLATSASALR